jgi:hypothetical protein
MIDHLHGDGIEIVSPSFMNQRALDPDRPVIAPHVEPSSEDAAAPAEPRVEDVAFDKAEEAATLAQLEAALQRTREAIADLADDATGSEESRKERQQVLTRRLAQIETAIARKRDEVESGE